MNIASYRKLVAFAVVFLLGKAASLGFDIGIPSDIVTDAVIGLVGMIGVFTFGNDHTSASFFDYARKCVVALVAVFGAWLAQHWGIGITDIQDELVNGVMLLAAPLSVYLFPNEAKP